MIEMRWVYHDMREGAPPRGAIQIGEQYHLLFQKLQYRFKENGEWSEWKDVA